MSVTLEQFVSDIRAIYFTKICGLVCMIFFTQKAASYVFAVFLSALVSF